jgi:hypothetical protein
VEPDDVIAYHRIISKIAGIKVFSTTPEGLKVVIAYFLPDRPETLVSVSVSIAQDVSIYL